MAPVPGVRLLERTIDRVWRANQSVISQEDHELGAIVLQLLAGCLRHVRDFRGSSVPKRQVTLEPLDAATVAAFGCKFNTWRERNLERKSAQAWQVAACIPDFDPTVGRGLGPAKSIRGAPPDGREVLQMQPRGLPERDVPEPSRAKLGSQ
jgi:hypothetical protein